MRQWVERLVEHGSGVALIPVATGTKLWQDVVYEHATAILYYRHRLNFLRRDGEDVDDMVSPQASALIAFSEIDADAIAASGLQGHLTRYAKVG